MFLKMTPSLAGEHADTVTTYDDEDAGPFDPSPVGETHPKMDILRIYSTYEGMHVTSGVSRTNLCVSPSIDSFWYHRNLTTLVYSDWR